MDTAIRAIAEPRRRDILRLVWDRERSSGEIASHFEITGPGVSQHLKVLKEAGLISERRDAQRRLFSVRPEGLGDLHSFLADVLPASLERLKQAAEKEEGSADARDPSRN